MDSSLLWVTAVGSVATALFTALLWMAAWKTLSGARGQLTLLREQVERDSRPYITVDIVPGLHNRGAWDLVVMNAGKSIAKEIKFEFDEWDRTGDEDYITEVLLAYLRRAAILVPGARKRVMWRSEASHNPKREAVGAPEMLEMAVSYKDEFDKSYRTEFALSVDGLGGAAPSPSEGSVRNGSADDFNKIMADINHALRALNVHVGELRR